MNDSSTEGVRGLEEKLSIKSGAINEETASTTAAMEKLQMSSARKGLRQ